MEKNEAKFSFRIGDRPTSDVVVRLRTQEGRDEWFYCHTHVLTKKSNYFADCLSKGWSTSQVLDSRNCIEVYCHESEFNSYVSVLRLLYTTDLNVCHGVWNTLGILQVSAHLGCHQLANSCMEYLEAVPWEETEEEEILKIVPNLGSEYASILSRLQPVEPMIVTRMFVSTIRFASSSLPTSLHELKSSAQEQLKYMLTEDDGMPSLNDNGMLKTEVSKCMKDLLIRLTSLTEPSFSASRSNMNMEHVETIKHFLADISWVSQILCKMEMMKELVHSWVNESTNLVNLIAFLNENAIMLDIVTRVTEVLANVLQAIAHGTVIVPTSKRIHMVKVWLPFVQKARVELEAMGSNDVDGTMIRPEDEIWQCLESAFISMVIALPSGDQADILSEWLRSEKVHYPDLTEAFELWCYRSKVAKRRLAYLEGYSDTAKL